MSYPSMKPLPYPTKKDGVPEAFVYRAEDDEKEEGVREQFAKFFKETSFTALVRIYNATSLVKRLTWLIVVLGMLSWLTLQCYWLIDRYFSFPMEVKMDLMAATELEYPSVTVCNQNPLRESMLYNEPFYSALEQHMQLQEVDMLYSYFNDFYYDDWYEEYDSEEKKGDRGEPYPGPTMFPPDFINTNPTGQTQTWSSQTSHSSTGQTSAKPTGHTGMPGTSTNGPSTDTSTDTDTQTHDPSTSLEPLTDMTTPSDEMTAPSDEMTTPSDEMTPPGEGMPPMPPMPPMPGKKRRRKRQTDMASFLTERNFNKWDMLDNSNISDSFYEGRDKEYIASMSYAIFSQSTDPNIVISGGHQANDFLIDCKFGGFSCSPRNFTTFVNHKYGNCFTFNAEGNGDVIKTRFAGPSFGLSLELYLNQQEYIPALSPSAGARILIHPRNSMPFPEDEGVSIAPGFSTSIGLRMIDIKRLTKPHGLCANIGVTEDLYNTHKGTSYSKLSCLKSCYQSLVIKHCHCALPTYFVNINSSIPVCNLTDSEEEKCSKNLPDMYPEEYTQCDQNCPQPCSEVRYDKTMSVAEWPSERYASHLQTKVQQSNYMFYGHEVEEDDFAKVEVYFEDLLFESIEQQKAYESQNLISDIGGQLGLWLGLSAITVGEIFSFIFSLGQALTRGWVPKRKHPTNTPIKPIHMDYT